MSALEKDEKIGRLKFWEYIWGDGGVRFHKDEVNSILKEQVQCANPTGKINKVFVPLCGKTVDMKWLSDHGCTVVGVEAVKKGIEEFYTNHGLEWTENDAPSMGPDCKLLQNKDRSIRIYCGDVMLYNRSLEGQFDFIWDRAAFVAVNRNDVKTYANLMKDILCPGGRMLMESVEYDVDNFKEFWHTPPPYPMFEDELKLLFEPECCVKHLERKTTTMHGKPYDVVYYLITKNI